MTAGMSHRRAVEIIQAGGNMIRLGVRRLIPPLLPPTTSSSDAKCPPPPPLPPMSYAPFTGPQPLVPSPGLIGSYNPPPPPPNLRLPQLFNPMPVHKSNAGQRPLLSSGKNLPPCGWIPPSFFFGLQVTRELMVCY